MLSSLVEHYKEVVFQIGMFFENTRREEETQAVPFHISAKNLNFDCDFMYDGKRLTGDSILPHYCAFPEHVMTYVNSGAKPFTCKGCENYKPTK